MYSVVLDSINKIYHSANNLPFQALNNISLKIKKGEFIAIVGPSGSGKSTLMNILGLLDQPTSGSYELDGCHISQLSQNTLSKLRNQKIGFVFQNFNLLQRASALHNVALPLIYSGVSRTERNDQAKKVLEQVGLSDKLFSYPNQLSGGQQQRVAIARALVTDPEIILADEPTGNLDTRTGTEIMRLFKSLNRHGKTVIVITHSPEIARISDRIIKLKDGQITKN